MSDAAWEEVDRFIAQKLISPQEAQPETLRENAAAGLPAIDVSAPQGKLLSLLAAAIGARRILEIGTLGGYSTIWFARALSRDGQIVTLEYEPRHVEVAKANIAREGISDRVDLRVGAALDLLPAVAGPFDLTFIDADKENNVRYFDWAVKLSRPGALIIVDNVVRAGALLDPATTDPTGKAARDLFDAVSKDARVSASAIQTVGSKGWDGFLLARVNS